MNEKLKASIKVKCPGKEKYGFDETRGSISINGEEKEKLLNLSKELNIEDRVHFLGFQKNPYKYMAQADLLILSSRYEGLPNVVLEANTCGLPVVAYNCPGGTREIIKDGLNGFLVECGNIDELAYKIEEAIKELNQYQNDMIVQEYLDQGVNLKKVILLFHGWELVEMREVE